MQGPPKSAAVPEAGRLASGGTGGTPGRAAAGGSFTGVDKGTPVFVQIADQLVSAIESGELPVGSRLPTEASLAERFQVSRASVREALSSLQFAGYVESRRGSGTVVLSPVPRGTGALDDRGLCRPRDVIDLLEARLAIEPEAVRLAAADPQPAALARLVRLLEGMELAVAQRYSRAHTDLGVHVALVRTCQNPFLVQAAENLITRSEGQLWRSVRDRAWHEGELPRTWFKHHHAIAQAIAQRHPNAAQAQIREHLLSVLRNVAASIELQPADQERVQAILTTNATGAAAADNAGNRGPVAGQNLFRTAAIGRQGHVSLERSLRHNVLQLF